MRAQGGRYNPAKLTMTNLEQKTARLTVLIDPAKKRAFEALCAKQDVTPSQVVRKLIREHLQRHGVQWVPGHDADAEEDPSQPVDDR